jgi:ABC-type microcin C transport system permease subunit YejB
MSSTGDSRSNEEKGVDGEIRTEPDCLFAPDNAPHQRFFWLVLNPPRFFGDRIFR